jgi:hypothetical protein
MMKQPKHRLGPFLGLSAGLGVVLALEIMGGPFFVPEAPPVRPGTKTALVAPGGAPGEPPAIETFSEIVARPLFAESRRPPSKAEVKVASNEPPPETLDLIGVVISARGRMALLRTLSTSEVTRAIEGQSVGGWEVSDIKPTQVVLRRGDDSEVIKINDAAAPPAGNTPAAAGDASSPAKASDAAAPSEAQPAVTQAISTAETRPAGASNAAAEPAPQPPGVPGMVPEE